MAQIRVKSDVTGKIWKVIATEGAAVAQEETLVVVESMKMEIPIVATAAGRVAAVLVKETDDVAEGQDVAIIET